MESQHPSAFASASASPTASSPPATSPSTFRKILGGGLVLAGVVTLLVLPFAAGSNPLPEGILVFGLVSILGGWVLTLSGFKSRQSGEQPAMGD